MPSEAWKALRRGEIDAEEYVARVRQEVDAQLEPTFARARAAFRKARREAFIDGMCAGWFISGVLSVIIWAVFR